MTKKMEWSHIDEAPGDMPKGLSIEEAADFFKDIYGFWDYYPEFAGVIVGVFPSKDGDSYAILFADGTILFVDTTKGAVFGENDAIVLTFALKALSSALSRR